MYYFFAKYMFLLREKEKRAAKKKWSQLRVCVNLREAEVQNTRGSLRRLPLSLHSLSKKYYFLMTTFLPSTM